MSLLNKFVSSELKIKPKGAKGGPNSKGKSSATKAGKRGLVAARKSGMTLGNFGALKAQVSVQGVLGGGGGGGKK